MSHSQPGSRDTSRPDTSAIRRLIRSVRTLLRSSWVATGVGVTLGLLFGILVAAALVDLLVPLWPGFRLAALVAVVLPTAIAFHTGVVRPLFRRLAAPRVARTIEPHLPGIHNRLVSVVDLDQHGVAEGVSPTFHQRLVAETLDRIRGFRPSQVVNFQNLKRAGLAAFLAVGAFLAAYTVFNDRLPTALARIFQPFADIPPVTDVFYEVRPGDTKVLRGDEIVLTAEVTKGAPDTLRVEITSTDTGKTLWYNLTPDGSTWSFPLVGFDESFDYRIHGGGTWSRRHHVTMIDRPQIVDLQTLLYYPKYMEIPEPRVNPPQQLDVSGPEESTVEVLVATAGDVARGEIQLLQTKTRQVEVDDRIERVWFSEAIPDGASPEGTWEWDLRLLARNAHTDPANPGLHRHLFHNAAKGLVVKPGDSLFAHVYIVPDQVPETIMLEWHDGQGWEHRAYWGADKIPHGAPQTASRRSMGPIPPAGQWTRLEVPAAAVDLEQKTIKGMAFSLFGGKAIWHRTGTLPAPFITEEELVVSEVFPLSQFASDQWGGRFPLKGTGYYRVELRNELGHPSQTMQEARYVSIPDNPPQIVVDRPGTDIVLSKPVRVPLSISAYDDFGLARIVLAVQAPGAVGFESRPILRYTTPVQTDDFLHTLDLPAMNLKPGEVLKYRVEAHDRKDQSRSTQEFSIRIQDDANAADRRLENFEKQQESIQEKFDKLVAEQARVEQKVEQLKQQNEALTEKIAQAQAEQTRQAAAEAAQNPPADPNQPPPPPKPLTLDPPTAQALADLRKELAEVARQEEQNANASQQIQQELKASAEVAAKLELLPPEISRQLQQIPERVQAEAVQPLQNLKTDLQQGAAPDKAPPSLPQLADQASDTQDNLESLQEQLAAINAATKQARQDARAGVDRLRETLLTQQARSTSKELANLQEFIQNLRKDLQNLETTEGQLQEATQTVPEVMLADVEDRQGKLEQVADPKLAQARELLNNPGELPESARTGRENSPYSQPAEEGLTPTPPESGKAPSPAPFQPALQGNSPRNQEKPRAEKPAVTPPAKQEGSTPEGQQKRQDLGDRQAAKMAELEAAENSLGSDVESLSQLLEELAEAAGLPQPQGTMPGESGESRPDNPSTPQPGDQAAGEKSAGEKSAPRPGPGDTQTQSPAGPPDPSARPDGSTPPADAPPGKRSEGATPVEATDPPAASSKPLDAAELAEMLNSERVQEARAMAARLQAAKLAADGTKPGQTPPRTPNAPQPAPPGGPASQVAALPPSAAQMDAVLQSLDLETRTVILKMQPRLREELLQGLREEGPEGYRGFIRNYYQRLAKVKGKP